MSAATTFARNTLRVVLPARLFAHIQSRRSRAFQLRWLKERGLLNVGKTFSDICGSAVLKGPFAGMKYPAPSINSRHSIPRLLGSYEQELHPIIDTALQSRYELVVDIGSAEGYYAVGFALKGDAPVMAFETDGDESRLCQEMARLNGVSNRLTTQSWCSRDKLCNLAAGRSCFVLSDCEGYEVELFDRSSIDALRRSDVLIEIHGEAYATLIERFAVTHKTTTITAMDRSVHDYPEIVCLGSDAERGINEYRETRQRWIFATPREAC